MSAPIFHRGKSYRLEDFPYDPTAKPERLTGLDKLRAVPDRGVAQALFELYFVAEKTTKRAAADAVQNDRPRPEPPRSDAG